jgi:nucleoside-diphosphate-sugar epimerase
MAATITRGSSVDGPARANLRTIAESAVETFEAFHQSSPGAHFVYCSTYKGYGPSGPGPIDPERPPQRPDPHSYGSAKALAERLLAIAAARLEAPYAIVRPTCIYGPGQHLHNAIPLFLSALWAGKPPTVFGTGRDVRDDVLASDLAHCLVEACLRKARGAFHATGERGRTIGEVAELCWATSRRRSSKGSRQKRSGSATARCRAALSTTRLRWFPHATAEDRRHGCDGARRPLHGGRAGARRA